MSHDLATYMHTHGDQKKEAIMAEGARLSCCLTFDFEAMSAWIGSFNSDNLSMISRGEFGAVVGLPP